MQYAATSRATSLWFVGVLLAVLAITPWVRGHAAAQPDLAPADPIAPVHRIAFDEAPDIRHVMFGPDDESLIVHVIVPYLDVWDAAVYFWPEVFGALALFLLVVLAIIAFRIRRRPRTAGLRYCRKCNYCLEGIDLTERQRCPECGTTLDARRGVALGRSLWQRMSVPMVLFVLANLPLVLLLVGETSRDSALLQGWFDWPTRRLVRPIMQTPIWDGLRQAAIRSGDLIRDVDLETGTVRRDIGLRTRDTRWEMAMSPSGDAVFLGSAESPTGVARVDLATGETTASIDTGLVATLPQRRHVIYVSPDGNEVYIAGSTATMSTSIRRWNWRSGELRTIFEEASPHAVDWTGEIQIVAIPDTPLPRFVIAVSDPQASRDFRVRLLGVSGEEQAERSFPGGSLIRPWRIRTVVDDHGSTLVHLTEPDGGRRIVWDLHTDSTRTISNGALPRGLDDWALADDGSLAVVPLRARRDAAVIAVDGPVTTPICTLSIPEDVFGPIPTLSRTHRWVAITALRDLSPTEMLTTGERYGHDVLLYDLSTLPPLASEH